MARAIARLHPNNALSAPTVCLAVNLRKAVGTSLAHHSMVGGLFLPSGKVLAEKSISEQAKAFREMVAEADSAYCHIPLWGKDCSHTGNEMFPGWE